MQRDREGGGQEKGEREGKRELGSNEIGVSMLTHTRAELRRARVKGDSI